MFEGKFSEAFISPNTRRTQNFNFSVLNIENNRFTGEISWLPTVMSELKVLNIAGNEFSDNINGCFQLLTQLIVLNIASNQFKGDIMKVVNMTAQVNLTILDVSNNLISGQLQDGFLPPAETENNLTAVPVLEIFAAGKNCILPEINPVICRLQSLEVISLDGLITAEQCQLLYFANSDVTSYHLDNQHEKTGRIPECVFLLPNLTTLHLSGNGLQGSLPTNLTALSQNLSDLSLSHNLLTGTIPLALQYNSWKVLDLSFNKLTGTLSPEIHSFIQSNQTALFLQGNRLSGFIPDQLLFADHIEVLDGNMFDCDLSSDGKEVLPVNDPEMKFYVCGSQNVNNSLSLWTGLASWFLIAVSVSLVFWMYKRLRSTTETTRITPLEQVQSIPAFEIEPEDILDQQISKKDVSSSSEKKFGARTVAFLTSRIAEYTEWWNKLDVVAVESNDQESQSTNLMNNHSNPIGNNQKVMKELLDFSSTLSLLQRSILYLTGFIVVVFLPSEFAMSHYYHTHSYQYIWSYSMAYLSGLLPSLYFLCVLVVFWCFVSYLMRSLHSHHKKLASKKDASEEEEEETMGWWQHGFRYSMYGLLIGVNCAVVFGMNVGYLLLLNQGISKTQQIILQIAVGVGKSIWSFIYIKRFMLYSLMYLESFSFSFTSYTSLNIVKILSLINVINLIIIPMVSISIFDSNCFKYLFFQPAEISTSYSFTKPEMYKWSSEELIYEYSVGITISDSLSYLPPAFQLQLPMLFHATERVYYYFHLQILHFHRSVVSGCHLGGMPGMVSVHYAKGLVSSSLSRQGGSVFTVAKRAKQRFCSHGFLLFVSRGGHLLYLHHW
jgi:hypothetical protein